jgi:hypothetical protein
MGMALVLPFGVLYCVMASVYMIVFDYFDGISGVAQVI